MTNKNKVIAVAVVLIAAFAAGRLSTPVKIKTVTQTVEIEKKVDTNEQIDHKKTTVTERDAPSGEKTIITTITDDRSVQTSDSDSASISQTQSKEIVKDSGGRLNLSLLAGENLSSLRSPPVYGLSASKNVLGPITAGVFGFENGTVGLSVGLSF
jgi:hypothetical protein